jgi:hypothetical protein
MLQTLSNRGFTLLETSGEWFVTTTALDPKIVLDPKFLARFSDWEKRMTGLNPQTRVHDLTVGAIIKGLTPGQLWGAVSACIAVVGGVAAFGAKFL